MKANQQATCSLLRTRCKHWEGWALSAEAGDKHWEEKGRASASQSPCGSSALWPDEPGGFQERCWVLFALPSSSLCGLVENSLGRNEGRRSPRGAGSAGGRAPWTGRRQGVPIAVLKVMPCAVQLQCWQSWAEWLMPNESYLICTWHSVTFFLFLFHFLKKKNVLQGQHEADKIWSKEGFYAIVIFLSIFVILVTCLMVSLPFTFILFFIFLILKDRVILYIFYMRGVFSSLLETQFQGKNWSLS